jgi:adhesin/invasin
MRRIASAALTALMAFSLMLTFTSTVQANALAGGGKSSSYSGESVFTNLPAGASGQFSVIFFNDGTTTWSPGVVGLLVCAADKVTCNVASPNAAYASGWFSPSVYATVSTTVGPGQNGFFIWNFTVPAGTAAGTVATFNGDVGDIATGLEYRPEGYFQQNKTPSAGGGLTISPASAAMPVGGTQQFTASGAGTGATISWSVTGGCGAITSAGLFAATATNSATQPCNVVASSSDGLTAVAPVTVFGPATQVSCSANPTSVVANGSNTVVFTFTLKDANGNTVSNASTPSLSVNNNTPTLITLSGGNSQTVTPSSGVASVTGTVSTLTGNIQVSASGTGVTGCNVIVASSAPGTATKTSASLSRNPIGADPNSTATLTISIQDANGNTVISDNSTVLTVTRDSNSANVCNITAVGTGTGGTFSAGSGSATAVNGVVSFTITATSTPGSCILAITTSNTSIAGTSATLTTQLVGAANKLAISDNSSPKPAATSDLSGTGGTNATCTKSNFSAGTITDPACIIVRVLVQDVNGLRVTDSTRQVTITATLDANTCTGAGGGSAAVRSATDTSSSGRATFAFTSAGAYSACSVTFSATGLTSVTTTMTWTAGGADHLTCSFSPAYIISDGSSTSTATVKVRDFIGNTVTTGSYSVTFSRNSGTSTTLLTANPQTTSGGSTTFTVRSSSALVASTDNYGPAITSGSTPTLPLAAPNGSCNITQQPTLP